MSGDARALSALANAVSALSERYAAELADRPEPLGRMLSSEAASVAEAMVKLGVVEEIWSEAALAGEPPRYPDRLADELRGNAPAIARGLAASPETLTKLLGIESAAVASAATAELRSLGAALLSKGTKESATALAEDPSGLLSLLAGEAALARAAE